MSSIWLFFLSNTPNPDDIQLFVIYDKEKQQIITFEKLEPEFFWAFLPFLLIISRLHNQIMTAVFIAGLQLMIFIQLIGRLFSCLVDKTSGK